MADYTLTIEGQARPVGVSAAVSGTSDITVAVPDGIEENDILFIAVESSGATVPAAPTDFTLLASSASMSNVARATVFYKVADGTELEAVIAHTGNHQTAAMLAVRGADTGGPIDVSVTRADASVASSFDVSGLTTTVNNALIVAVIAHERARSFSGISFDSSSVVSETKQTDASTTGGDDGTLAVFTAAKETAGATGDLNAFLVGTTPSGRVAVVIFSIVPGVGSGGDYSITGSSAALRLGLVMALDPGSYALTGTAASFRAVRSMAAAAGSYAITGTAATLSSTRSLVVEAGSYALTGTDVMLSTLKGILANAGAYVLTGTAATFTLGRTLIAAAGSYLFTGTDAELTADIREFPEGPAPKARTISARGQRERSITA